MSTPHQTGSSDPASSAVPGNGHQNVSDAVKAPASTRPQNTPIGTQSNLRRTNRGRPIVGDQPLGHIQPLAGQRRLVRRKQVAGRGEGSLHLAC